MRMRPAMVLSELARTRKSSWFTQAFSHMTSDPTIQFAKDEAGCSSPSPNLTASRFLQDPARAGGATMSSFFSHPLLAWRVACFFLPPAQHTFPSLFR